MSLIFTVPWAFLSAVLLVFGRLSSDNELIRKGSILARILYRGIFSTFIVGFWLALLVTVPVWVALTALYARYRRRVLIEFDAFLKPHEDRVLHASS